MHDRGVTYLLCFMAFYTRVKIFFIVWTWMIGKRYLWNVYHKKLKVYFIDKANCLQVMLTSRVTTVGFVNLFQKNKNKFLSILMAAHISSSAHPQTWLTERLGLSSRDAGKKSPTGFKMLHLYLIEYNCLIRIIYILVVRFILMEKLSGLSLGLNSKKRITWY